MCSSDLYAARGADEWKRAKSQRKREGQRKRELSEFGNHWALT